MTSALGFTPEHYAAARRTSGERAWAALYLGVPAAPEGGLVKREWLDVWRLTAAPQRPVMTVVGVDPSDSGSADSCGLVAASMTSEGVAAVIADESAPMTSDAWARAAVGLALDVGRRRSRSSRSPPERRISGCCATRCRAPGPTGSSKSARGRRKAPARRR